MIPLHQSGAPRCRPTRAAIVLVHSQPHEWNMAGRTSVNTICIWYLYNDRTHAVHASQGHKVGLYTPPILGGNSNLSWFYDMGAIKDSAHTGTSKGIAQAIKRGPIRKFLPNYANVYITIQSHGLSAGERTHYVTANGVRNRLL